MTLPVIDSCAMNDRKNTTLPQDSSWVLDQIEMGLRQIEPRSRQIPPLVPKLSYVEIESTVTRALQEELDRLDGKDQR
jgi:hypothetical protein